MSVVADFLWIPPSLGGHKAPPWPGMRLGTHWKRTDENGEDLYKDIVCDRLMEFEPSTGIGTGEFRLAVNDVDLAVGTILELRSGERLICVAQVRELLSNP